ncbi:hypothetical protein ACHAW6_002247 [Cyclotella cf. meneghiniana]
MCHMVEPIKSSVDLMCPWELLTWIISRECMGKHSSRREGAIDQRVCQEIALMNTSMIKKLDTARHWSLCLMGTPFLSIAQKMEPESDEYILSQTPATTMQNTGWMMQITAGMPQLILQMPGRQNGGLIGNLHFFIGGRDECCKFSGSCKVMLG